MIKKNYNISFSLTYSLIYSVFTLNVYQIKRTFFSNICRMETGLNNDNFKVVQFDRLAFHVTCNQISLSLSYFNLDFNFYLLHKKKTKDN